MAVELQEISSFREFLALTSIRVKPEQRRFTKNAILTWMQTRHPAVSTYSIMHEGGLVGFVMLIHAENPTQWIIERLTIDGAHQGRGLGHAVADQLIDMVHEFENSEMMIARYRPENEAARQLFAKLGFAEREELFRGRHVATLEFEFEEVAADDTDDDEADWEDGAEDDADAGWDDEDDEEDEDDDDWEDDSDDWEGDDADDDQVKR